MMFLFLDTGFPGGLIVPSRLMIQRTPDYNDPNPPMLLESAAQFPPAPEAQPLLHSTLNTLLRR